MQKPLNNRNSIVSDTAIRQSTKSTLREYTEAIIIALVLALFIRTFIVQAFKIPSGSMIPTLKIGDHLLVNKFIYGIRVPFSRKMLIPIKEPKLYDIIVFKYPEDPSLDYIKRVIGVEGDTVEARNKQIYVNGEPIEDKYAYHTIDADIPGIKECHGESPHPALKHDQSCRDNFGPYKVPEGKVFVMGDNRENSSDSRFWGFVDKEAILGKALIIYWSWDVTKKPFYSIDRIASIRWSRLGDIIH